MIDTAEQKANGKYLLKFYIFMMMYIAAALFILYLTLRLNFGWFSAGGIFSGGSAAVDINAAYSGGKAAVIIDAGHGGIDGGAVGVDGIYEKDINLLVAQKLERLLTIANIDVVMTRKTDTLLNSEGAKKIKASDLSNRLKVAQKYPDGIFISIHMNKFPQEKYSGLQVFYSANDIQSANLADIIKRNNQKYLQPNNNREIKRGKDIYIMENIKNCAVLVECGFLSNHEEAHLLNSDEYQNKLSKILFISLLQHLNGET